MSYHRQREQNSNKDRWKQVGRVGIFPQNFEKTKNQSTPFLLMAQINVYCLSTKIQTASIGPVNIILLHCMYIINYYVYITEFSRPVVPGGAGGAMASPDFGKFVNPFSTRGDRLYPPTIPHINTRPPRFSDLPTFLLTKVRRCQKVTQTKFSVSCLSA